MKRVTGLVLGLLCAACLFAQNVANYMEQGGARWVVGGSLDVVSGGDLDVESGGSLKLAGTAITATAAQLNAAGAGTTSSGIGAAAGAGVSAAEFGTAAVHRTVLTLTSVSLTMTDAGAAGSHGGTKIYDFPEGVIIRGGCVADTTTLAGAGGIADAAAVVLALGLAAPATDNATLVGTNEADFIASFAGTLTAGAGTFKKYGEPSATSLDGHTTAADLFLNAAVPDADSSASDTLAVTGTITCLWSSSGDF